MILQPILLNIFLLSSTSLAQAIGAATGFAKGVTGGGSATPASPADINEWVLFVHSQDGGGMNKQMLIEQIANMAHRFHPSRHHVEKGV